VYRRVPGAQRLNRSLIYWGREALGYGFLHPRVNRFLQRVAEVHLRRQVRDPELRAKLTPRFVMGCKRLLVSNDYLPALTQPNVAVVSEPITEVRADGVVTADGTAHPVDTIILGTGFRVTDVSLMRHVTGRDGRPVAEAWSPTMKAYLGTTLAGFPNLFVLLGPNTGLGHTSVVLMIESQLRHLLDVLAHQRRHDLVAMEPTEPAQWRWTELVDQRMAGTVWAQGGCLSWYLDATGRNSTLWPGYATGYRLRLGRFRPGVYTVLTGDLVGVPLSARSERQRAPQSRA
jgi:cation diffusion facilitator CzcD-associated flavoprotein CzcO